MADVCLEPASPTPTFHSPFTKKSLASSQDFTKSPLCAKELTSDDAKSTASPLRRPFANITNSGPLQTDELGTSPLKRDFQIFNGSRAELNLASSQAAAVDSDDDIFTPRKTPKRRSVLLSRNQDVIDKYRCSVDGSEKAHFLVNAEKVMAESLAQDDEMMTEMRRELQESKEAQRSAEDKLSQQEEQLSEAQKRVELLEAEVEAVHERQVGKREAGKLRKALAQHEVLFELLCRHVDAETVLKCEAVAGIKHHTEEGEVFRHSLEVMKTLPEEEEELGLGDMEEGEVSVLAMSVLGSLKKELSNAREEAESLRQTADACWVREQAACKRIQELEEEGRELSAFTQQMAQAHSRLTAGVQELTEKQRSMVPLQTLHDKDRDLEEARREAEKERERAAEMEEQLEEQHAAVRALESESSKKFQEVKKEAWASAEAKMEEMEKSHAEAYKVLTKRIAFLQEELAESSSLEGEAEAEEGEHANSSLELLYGEEGGGTWFSPRKKPRRKLGLAPRSPGSASKPESKVACRKGGGGFGAGRFMVAVLAVLLALFLSLSWPEQHATPMPLIM